MTANRRQFLGALGCTALLPAARAGTVRPSAALDETLAELGTSACQVIHRGRVVFSHGDPSRLSYLASARKSLVSMVYGPAVSRGEIDLDATLESIGFDDLGGLLPVERSATLRHLLMARSGIYHPAANLGDASDRAPPRGSVTPGSYFLYNNWDFNALGALYEKLTGRGLYEGFEVDIARPIGLQDWDATAQPVRNDTGASSHPAQHFVLSTRDMARLGLLMLEQGRHDRRTVLSRRWVGLTTRTSTPAAEVARTSPFIAGLGYGYLWWTFDDAARWGRALTGAFTASGAFGQFITAAQYR
jgi:CubicO group peptidase (beta-lactamase class C family)